MGRSRQARKCGETTLTAHEVQLLRDRGARHERLAEPPVEKDLGQVGRNADSAMAVLYERRAGP